jgi:carboxymethylenebutenolidase
MSEKRFNRRDFVRQGMRGLAGLFGEDSRSSSQKVEAGDIRIMSAMADYPVEDGRISGFIARPEKAGVYPSLIIIHEISGLNDHIRDAATRFAQEGFVAVAPNLFSREAPVEGRDDLPDTPEMVRSIPDERLLTDLEATIDHLDVLTFVDSTRIGVVGFCMGGLYAFLLAARSARIRAVADFYGRIVYPVRTPEKPEAPIDAAPRLRCPLLGLFGAADPVIPLGDIYRLRDTLIQHKKPFEIKVYPDAPHAFFDDTRPSYRPEIAQDAWARTIAFFWKHLKGSNT